LAHYRLLHFLEQITLLHSAYQQQALLIVGFHSGQNHPGNYLQQIPVMKQHVQISFSEAYIVFFVFIMFRLKKQNIIHNLSTGCFYMGQHTLMACMLHVSSTNLSSAAFFQIVCVQQQITE
jgi:hypothetical protein